LLGGALIGGNSRNKICNDKWRRSKLRSTGIERSSSSKRNKRGSGDSPAPFTDGRGDDSDNIHP
jgi:hypothetical protein